MRGDLVLYKGPRNFAQWLVTWATHGPYYHVEIALDAFQTIGAHASGISYGNVPTDIKLYTLVSPSVNQGNIAVGITWALAQKGKAYGYMDLVAQVIKFLLPNNPFQLVQHDHWDCSDFATRYLMECEVPLPDEYSDPYQNTPNDLARVFHLLPPRKSLL